MTACSPSLTFSISRIISHAWGYTDTHSVSPLGINVSDVDLHRAVILGLDQAVGSAALARDVQIHGGAGSVLPGEGEEG